jgi:DNA-binding XRE family transcriptional regulator
MGRNLKSSDLQSQNVCYEEFSRAIREFRELHGISQREMAKLCGLSPNTVAQAERGYCTSRTRTKILAKQRYLGINHNMNRGEM